jgi:hypothetical protein
MYESFLNKSIIDVFRVLIILCILIFASYSDYIDRTISTKVWYVAFSFGLLITIYELLTENIWNVSSSILISVSVMFIIGYILQYTRIFYGADYRAFVIIGFMIPTYPDIFSLPLYDFSTYGSIEQVQFLGRYSITNNFQQLSLFLHELLVYVSSSVFGISVFVNSSIIASGFFFFNIYKNIENGDFTIRRPLRSLSARKIQKENLTNTYSIIIEETDNSNFIFRGVEYITSGLKGLSTSFYIEYMKWYRNKEKLNKNKTIKDIDTIQIEEFIEDNDDWRLESNDDIEEIKDFTEKYLESDELWVTISIPFIIPITIGTIASIAFGNLAYIILILI